MTSISTPYPRRSGLIAQILAALTLGLLLFFVAVTAATVSFQLWYAGRIFPGVSVGGVDLSGLAPGDAALKLNQVMTYPQTGRLLFRDGDKVWLATPLELGLVFDAAGSARQAYRLGRSGGLFGSLAGQMQAWQGGVDISPAMIFDQRVAYHYLQTLALQIDSPMIEASLNIQGTEVTALPGQIGHSLNVDATLAALTAQLQTFSDGEVPLVIEERTPQILDASAQAETARRILSTSLTLVLPDAQEGDPGPWVIDVATLAQMLLIERVKTDSRSQYTVTLNLQTLQPLLEEISEKVERQSANARFIFNDDTRQLELIQPAVTGRALNMEAALAVINQKLMQGEHVMPLEMVSTPPAVGNDATAESLGIRELVSVQSTYFHGSSEARIQNIQTAAARFHGLLVAPGETFSMAAALGDVSLDNGYTEALIIYGDRTIKGVGGGVCQVSTTLFRTVFFGGFQIDERHPHAYRVYYYEQQPGGGIDAQWAGMDATVFVPLVDFRFTNDTPYWLLMETYINVKSRRITWKFYSTADGRTVEWSTTGPQNTVPPPEPLFRENPDLAAGEIKQVDWDAEGADITVTRLVRRNGGILYEDVIRTHYKAWQAVCEYGPGTEDPLGVAQARDLCQP